MGPQSVHIEQILNVRRQHWLALSTSKHMTAREPLALNVIISLVLSVSSVYKLETQEYFGKILILTTFLNVTCVNNVFQCRDFLIRGSECVVKV